MTVQELIDKLQQIENKSIQVVILNTELGYYNPIDSCHEETIPETMDSSDDWKEEISQIPVVFLGI